MKIAQIGPYPLSANCIKGGVETSVFGLAQELTKTNEVVCFDIPRMDVVNAKETSEGVLVYRYKNTGTNQRDMIRCKDQMVLDILSEHPEICHIHGTSLLALLLYKELSRYGIKMMLTVHGLLFVEKKNQFYRNPSLRNLYKLWYQSRAEFALLKMASQAIVDTDYVAEALNHYPCRIPKLNTIPQGINQRYFTMQCSSLSKVILSVGSIGMRKGHFYTVEAFNKIRAKGIYAKLKIYGVLAEESYFKQLQSRISSSPYSSDIELHPNASVDELLEAYKEASVFALHSQEESQGIVFAEAMACGLPIVATNVGGIPYVVKHGECGLLSNYGDVDSMSNNLEKLLTDQKMHSKMSLNAKHLAKDYDWSVIANRIIELYRM